MLTMSISGDANIRQEPVHERTDILNSSKSHIAPASRNFQPGTTSAMHRATAAVRNFHLGIGGANPYNLARHGIARVVGIFVASSCTPGSGFDW
jgi:hypothetical protein